MLKPCALVLLPLAVAIAAGVSAPTYPLVDLPTFVVVGGGFKGAFIAANLAQPGHNKVLLLESADKLVRLSQNLSRCFVLALTIARCASPNHRTACCALTTVRTRARAGAELGRHQG